MSDKMIWIIGGNPDCDLVIDLPSVSGRHCRLSVRPDGSFVVVDLGSTNGTFVNGKRIQAETPVTREDAITLGSTVPMPWPSAPIPRGVEKIIRVGRLSESVVGRDPSCEHVFDDPVVSGRHARFVRRSNGLIIVEDLGSSNGTYVNGRRIESATNVRSGDLIGFGSHVVRLVVDPIEATTDSAPESNEARPSHLLIPVSYVFAAGMGLGIQSLVLAGLIYGVGKASNASSLFGLCLASVWVGLTSAFFERLWDAAFIGRGSARLVELARSHLRASAVALVCSLVLFGLVPVYVPTASSWPMAWVILGLSALIGTALGLAVVRVAGRRAVGIPVAVWLILLVPVLCVPLRPSRALGPVGRSAASTLPTRWAFEALTLLSAGDKADDPVNDPVEPFFPAETDRAGVAACASALLAMLGGLVYADAFMALSRAPKVGPVSR